MKQCSTICSNCVIGKFCLPAGIDPASLGELDQVIKEQPVVAAGDCLFEAGDSFEHLLVVRSGSFKTFYVTPDGREQVSGFVFPGEMLGFDAIYDRRYHQTAQALEHSSACSVAFEDLLQASASMPQLQRRLLSLMSKKINTMAISVNSTADQRMATFLLSLSSRFSQLGFSPRAFQLSMSRQDIANYLGLTTETVSRVLTKFQKAGWLSINRRAVELSNLRQLQIISFGVREQSTNVNT